MRTWWNDAWGTTRETRIWALIRWAVFTGCVTPFVFAGSVLRNGAGIAGFGIGLLAAMAAGAAVHLAIEAVGGSVAEVLGRVTGRIGNGAPAAFEHSGLQALVVQGRVPEALEGYAAALAAAPRDAGLRLHVADVYARAAEDPIQAAAHFRSARDLLLARRHAGQARWEEGVLYATQRLIDLYDGPLNEQGRALVELRRLCELFPGRREAFGARQAIARRKLGHRSDRSESDAG